MVATMLAPRSSRPLRTMLRAIARLCAFICSERFVRAQLQFVDLLCTCYPLTMGLASHLSVAA